MIKKNRKIYLEKLSCLCFLLTLLFFYREGHADGLRIVMFDVGMGQSVLLVEDGNGLLIDTGLAEYAPHILERMKFYGVKKLDYLLLSHLHADHAAGYFQIRAVWPKTEVFDSCAIPEELHSSEESSYGMLRDALEKDSLHNCLSAGDTVSWQGHQLHVLWPKVLQQKNLNQSSLVLLLITKTGKNVLIMGDVDKNVEKELIPSLQTFLPRGVDIHVAGHHAAIDSCDPDFLSMLHPEVALISVGKNNLLGYPAEGSLTVLEKYGNTVQRTDKEGEICYVLGSEKVVPCTTLK
ncbi:MAG: MBL fold metallo-hydrolase [Desulfocapsa sp.]|nr:MBL fold metallo-hydrolase [Desulfocapsa sp.]